MLQREDIVGAGLVPAPLAHKAVFERKRAVNKAKASNDEVSSK